MNRRTKKVASLILSELSQVLSMEVCDPVLSGMVFTEVVLSNDLRQARVFYRSDEGHNAKETTKALLRARGFMRKRLGETLELRYVPELYFEQDQHSEAVYRVMKLIGASSVP